MVKSIISPKVEIRDSDIHNLGMFATETIEENEIVFIHGGHIVTRDELYSSEIIGSYLPLDDNYFIGAKNAREEKALKLFVNHSCNPSCGIRGEITFVAMRKINKGEELTIDYATVDNEDYRFECNCKSSGCRKLITGFDWKIKTLQDKYRDYFARYLADKIRST